MKAPTCARLSTKSLTSPPAQKARPAPVTTTQRTAGSSSTSRAAWNSSRPRPRLSALYASGRLSVIVVTLSLRSRVRYLKSIAVVLRSGSLNTPPGRAGDHVEHFADPQRLHEHEIDALGVALLGR